MKRGRPTIPKRERRDVVVRVMVTAAHKVQLEAKARQRGLSVSTWLLTLALGA